MAKERMGVRFTSRDILSLLKRGMGELPAQAVRSARVAEVHYRWKTAVEQVYKESAPLVLNHTNAVYIMRPDESDDKLAQRVPPGKTLLIVYSDDSMVRSDIDARQEFLKMRLNEQGEHVEFFSIKASKQGMKTRHPFVSDTRDPFGNALPGSREEAKLEKQLDPSQSEQLSKQAESIENRELREALTRAIKANTRL